MSISSIINTNPARQWQPMPRLRNSAPPPAPSGDSSASGTTASGGISGGQGWPAGLLSNGARGAATPYDSIKVNLPNGLSIGIAHIGPDTDPAMEDQMVKSVEQMVSALEGYTGVGSGDKPSSNAGTPAADTAGSQAMPSGAVSIDMIHVDLPNGTSIEIRHAATANETASESQGFADQMVNAADELAAALKAYTGASSNTAANGNSQRQPSAGLTA